MSRDNEKRLRQLEAELARQPSWQQEIMFYLTHLVASAIAYHFGDPRPEESPRTAYARALGYEDSLEFDNAFRTQSPEFVEKHFRAKLALFAKFGVTHLDDSEAIGDALDRIKASLPESYRPRRR
jgi:hypothetical protein